MHMHLWLQMRIRNKFGKRDMVLLSCLVEIWESSNGPPPCFRDLEVLGNQQLKLRSG